MNYFEEKQIFQLRSIIIPITIFSVLPVLVVADGPDKWIGLLIVGVTMLLSGLLLFSMKQIIRINEDGIHYKQGPFHRSFRCLPWSAIKNWKINKLNALGDFGGWGIRITRKKKGYIIEGEYSLEIQTEEKKLTVLSIKNKVAAEQAMAAFLPLV